MSLRLLPAALALGLAVSAALPAAATEAPAPLVSADWLAANAGAEDVVVLDLQTPGKEGYGAGHVPGAVSAHYPGAWRTTRDGVSGVLPATSQIEAYLSGLGIGDEDVVVVVPEGKNATDFGAAARVYWTLKELGHEAVTILDGGLAGWIADGRPAETAATEPEPDLFGAVPRDTLLVSTAEVSEKLGSDAVFIDARPEPFYAGKEKHPDAARFGRLPGAINLPHETFYDPETNRLRPVEALKAAVPAKLAEAREAGREIVSYCNTGHWAASDWFVLSELLGYDVRLYDESMVGWTADAERPVDSERTRFDDLKAWILGSL